MYAFSSPILHSVSLGPNSYPLASTRLAIHCNLHKITSPNIAQYPPSVLPAPATSLELRDRLNLFWMAYTTDRSRSLHYQTQVTLHDEVRKTCLKFGLMVQVADGEVFRKSQLSFRNRWMNIHWSAPYFFESVEPGG
jgi:hypothetical protein